MHPRIRAPNREARAIISMALKVVFSFLAQFHQVLHSLPIALELARRHPDIEVHAVGATPAHADFIRRLADRHAADVPLRHDGSLRIGWYERRRVANGGTILIKPCALLRNRAYFAGFDAVIVPERSSLFLKRLRLPNTRLIWTRHGAGDREVGFARDINRFDFVLLAGRKIEQRLLERKLIRPGDYATGVYAKFDWMKPQALGRRLFDNDRPSVLYAPHFRPRLSSWPKWGMDVLDFFANSDRYNLIFAPHVRLFDPLSSECSRRFEAYRKLPHMRIDLGSERSIDMTYTSAADLYLGDVSSQVAEYLHRPRPCVFLNAHGVDWRGDPNYRFWSLGPVVDDKHALAAGLDAAFRTHAAFEAEQRRYFEDSFGIMPGESSAARGADAIAEFLRRPSTRTRR